MFFMQMAPYKSTRDRGLITCQRPKISTANQGESLLPKWLTNAWKEMPGDLTEGFVGFRHQVPFAWAHNDFNQAAAAFFARVVSRPNNACASEKCRWHKLNWLDSTRSNDKCWDQLLDGHASKKIVANHCVTNACQKQLCIDVSTIVGSGSSGSFDFFKAKKMTVQMLMCRPGRSSTVVSNPSDGGQNECCEHNFSIFSSTSDTIKYDTIASLLSSIGQQPGSTFLTIAAPWNLFGICIHVFHCCMCPYAPGSYQLQSKLI